MSAIPDLRAYRRIVVAFSGGKDSLAALFHLLDLGVPAHAIELHHHDVDGRGPTFMDWPCTAGYVRAIAEHLGIAVYFSWREGGFARELDRADAPTAPIRFETPDGMGHDPPWFRATNSAIHKMSEPFGCETPIGVTT